MKKRNIMYIAIMIICVIAIIVGVYYQVFSKKEKNEITTGETNSIPNNNTQVTSSQELLAEFNSLFGNRLNKQMNRTDDVTRISGLEEQDVIYTVYDIQESKENQYEIDIKLPVFNVAGDVAAKFNENTQEIFVNKANNILSGTDKYTIYNVEYVAYINDNILSLVIKSTLKEGNSAQRIIVQTYNYNMETDEEVSLNDVLKIYGISATSVNEKIEIQVREASKESETISSATGQIVYKRDLNSAMYITDNVNNFFIGKDGQIYIIYAYGNTNLTSETDIIKI